MSGLGESITIIVTLDGHATIEQQRLIHIDVRFLMKIYFLT